MEWAPDPKLICYNYLNLTIPRFVCSRTSSDVGFCGDVVVSFHSLDAWRSGSESKQKAQTSSTSNCSGEQQNNPMSSTMILDRAVIRCQTFLALGSSSHLDLILRSITKKVKLFRVPHWAITRILTRAYLLSRYTVGPRDVSSPIKLIIGRCSELCF